MRNEIKIGDMVRYIGEDTVTYRRGGIYKVTAYDSELDMYGVMSELGEDYCLSRDQIEVVNGD